MRNKEQQLQQLFDSLEALPYRKLYKVVRKIAKLNDSKWLTDATRSEQDSIRLLGDYDEDWVLPCLLAAVRSDEFKRSAVRGLGQTGKTHAIEPIIVAMQSDRGIAVIGAKALVKLGQPEWRRWIRGDADDILRLRESGNPDAARIVDAWESAAAAREQQREIKRQEKRARRESAKLEKQEQQTTAKEPEVELRSKDYWPFMFGVFVIAGLGATPFLLGLFIDKPRHELVPLSLIACFLFALIHSKNLEINFNRILLMAIPLLFPVDSIKQITSGNDALMYPHNTSGDNGGLLSTVADKGELVTIAIVGFIAMTVCGRLGVGIAKITGISKLFSKDQK